MTHMHNLAQLLEQWASSPHKLLYRQFVDGNWQDFTAADLLAMAARWQAGYIHSGLQAGDRVALCMKNSIHWVAADIAAHGLGLVVVPLYVDDNADNMLWCLQDSGAKLLVADHLRFLPALQKSMDQLPQILLVRGEAPAPVIMLADWLPVLASGFSIVQQADDALATIVYTSGTMGRSKGVMLSHRNILANVTAIVQAYPVYETDRLLSVLPLSHMFERTAGYYLALQGGAQVVYCRSINDLAQDLAEQQPTVIMAVPRLFERMLTRIDERLAATPIKRWLFYLAARSGWRHFKGEMRIRDRLIMKFIHPKISGPLIARLGGRLRQAVMGGAALDQRVAETMIGLGVPLLQGYGLTEASPVVAVNRPHNNDPASVGAPLAEIETRLSEHAELMLRGPTVMQGYWQNPAATAEVIDADGWLNTGDVVEIIQGRIYIHGRSKNILVLSNGEKIAPEDIEQAIMQDSHFEQVMVVGEARPFLVLLAVSRHADSRDLLKRANQQIRHLPRYARIRAVIVAEQPWDAEGGLLTPTLKIKRRAIYERYLPQIEAAYKRD